MSRCQCIIHRSTGDVYRCAVDVNNDAEFCYAHQKYFDIDRHMPAPRDCKWSGDGHVVPDYIISVSNLDGSKSRWFDYEDQKPVTMYQGLRVS
jgi:hypothetical protein